MIKSEVRFTLDIRALASQVSLGVKKGETGRRLRIHLTENGYPYHIPENCFAVFTAKKPDGNDIFNDCVIEDCEILYDVTEQTVSATGLLLCAINLYGVEGELLISANFQMIVYIPPVDQSSLESTSEYKALATLIAEAYDLKKGMEQGSTGGTPGNGSGQKEICILGEGETVDDAPAGATIIIDPYAETDEPATQKWVTAQINQVKNDMPNTNGLASETWVTAQINQVKQDMPDTNGLASETWVTAQINQVKQDMPDTNGLASETWVTSQIQAAVNATWEASY